MTLEDLAVTFGDKFAVLQMIAGLDERMDEAVQRIGREAVELARNGAQCIVLARSRT